MSSRFLRHEQRSNDGAAVTASCYSPVFARPRDHFLADGLDVEDRICTYERISDHCPTLMLANAIFRLEETESAWYETQEYDLACPDACKAQLREVPDRPIGRHQAAKRRAELLRPDID